jgi:acetoin utilization protein AcuC
LLLPALGGAADGSGDARAFARARAWAGGGGGVATGGGGYQPIRVLPRAWTIVWCAVSGRPIPERVDEGWRSAWQARAGVEPLAETYLDPDYDEPRAASAARVNAATVDEVLRLHEL